jgi:TIR domain
MATAPASIFISYRHAPPWTALSQKLYLKLRAATPDSTEVFRDDQIRSGDEWERIVNTALQRCTHFVALLCDEYWVLSHECRRELQVAVQRRHASGGASPKLLFIQGASIRAELMRLDGQKAGELQGDQTGLEHLGKINFLGPFDTHGRLVTLASDRRRLDLQLGQLRDRLLLA